MVKSCSVKRNAKKARGLGRDSTAPFPKLRASYFRFARFNTSAPYYLRAWHRLFPEALFITPGEDVLSTGDLLPAGRNEQGLALQECDN